MKKELKFLMFLMSVSFLNVTFGQQWVDTIYSIQTIQDVKYGKSIDFAGAEQDLLMDISFPVDDPAPQCGRPLLVMVHGGAWLKGDKADPNGYAWRIRRDFAKRGFTTASVNYRLGQFHTDKNVHCNIPDWDCLNMTDSSEWYRANFRGIQDVHGAIRYLVNNASTYNIDPNNIFVVGESAGGFIALGVGFLDDPSEVLDVLKGAYPNAPPPNAIYEAPCIQGYDLAASIASMHLGRPDLGSYEGTLNLPAAGTYKIRGVGNFYGGVFNNIFQSYHPDPPALYMFHQPCDLIVPYNYGRVLKGYVSCLNGFPAYCGNIINRPYVYGSKGITKLINDLDADGVPTNEFYFDNTSNNFNCLQQATNSSMQCHAIDGYWVRTTNMATFFASKIDSCSTVGLTEEQGEGQRFKIFPNPASYYGNVYVSGAFQKNDRVELFNINGAKIFEKVISNKVNQIKINPSLRNLEDGIYYIRITNRNKIETKKILIVD